MQEAEAVRHRLEALDPFAELEGARVTLSPFTVDELEKSQGHDPEFLGDGIRTVLPGVVANDDKKALRDELIHRLNYMHFSILFDARKKQALATIVDIDGRHWRRIKRKPGDVWYPDPRVSTQDQPQARDFSKPDPRIDPKKNHFAFGHLVRRLDPCWDDPDKAADAAESDAAIAELQTFHLTNASPQAEGLNAGIWNDLEDLVLDDLTKRLKVRAVVVSGPLFDDTKRVLIHGEMPVPREYFKIVAWKSEGRLAAAGWVQRQPDEVMPPTLEAVLPFEEQKGVKASLMWLRPIREIAKQAKLDLSIYEAGDTYALRKPEIRLETVFAPAGPLVANADDLLLTAALPLDDRDERSALRNAVAPMLAYREREELPKPRGPSAKPRGRAGDAVPESAAPATVRAESVPTGTAVSAAAFKLIVDYETGGRSYYENYFKKRPVWPKAASGITIGFGYDLGYVTAAEFARDWAALPAADLAQLAATVGMHGGKNSDAAMSTALARVKGVVIEWDPAEAVFKAATLPKFEALTRGALKNTQLLSGDCFGVLVSLTFNRGASYSHKPKPGQRDRWIQMRAIRDAMAAQRFADIPGQILAMIPIWRGTAIETGMKRRRTDEAALFKRGLNAGAVPEGAAIPRLEAVAAATGTELPDDAELWPDMTEEEEASAALADGPVVSLESTGVAWARDAASPDYAHLGRPASVGSVFALTAADLETLVDLNGFADGLTGDRVLFGLRGAMIVTDHTRPGGITLMDLRPDHGTARCVMGVWNRSTRSLAVFPGSTVPNAAAVRNWRATKRAGNLLATGCYGYVVGTHNSKPGCFLLRETTAVKRTVVVRRSSDDLTYDLGDLADMCAPGDNIHPTLRSSVAGFSSVGCQTVVGSATPAGKHSGPWSEFRKAAGLPKPDGTPFTYVLLTGAEARIASELRRNGLASDPASLSGLRRLRFGSKGDAVRRLQEKLGLSRADGSFGPATAARLHASQRGFPGSRGSDGIFTPDLDAALGWSVFAA